MMKLMPLFLLALLIAGCELIDIFDVEVDLVAEDAIEKKDPSMCKEIEDERSAEETIRRRENCYEKVAIGLKDIKVCELIKGKWDIEGCVIDVAEEKGDMYPCYRLTDSNKDRCFSAVGIKMKDLTICDEAESEDVKWACYGKVGAALHDLTICDKINEKHLAAQSSCIQEVAFFQDDVSVCNDIPDFRALENCIIEFAEKDKNEDLCKDLEKKGSCYLVVASEMLDYTLCKKIQSNHQEELCLANVAAKKKDASICKHIIDEHMLSSCYMAVANEANDPSLCERVEEEDRERCLEAAS